MTGLEKIGDADNVAVARADLLAHPAAPVGARLEIGDADDILVAHPQRQKSRGLLGQR